MMKGKVIRYIGDRGFGFVQDEDSGEQFFVHITEAQKAGIGELREGMALEFLAEVDARSGKCRAVDLRLVR